MIVEVGESQPCSIFFPLIVLKADLRGNLMNTIHVRGTCLPLFIWHLINTGLGLSGKSNVQNLYSSRVSIRHYDDPKIHYDDQLKAPHAYSYLGQELLAVTCLEHISYCLFGAIIVKT